MKKLISSIAMVALLATSSFSAVTINYYNQDSETHVFEAKGGGTTKKVEFGSVRTAAVTVQVGTSSCVIKTKCGDVEVKSGDKIEIKNGCITVK